MRYIICLVIALIIFSAPCFAQGVATRVRIKDVAALTGSGEGKLLGYGLVVGLAGTGDSDKTGFTGQSLRSMLERMGMALREEELQVKNVAAVVVTADVTPSAPQGSRFDVTVSSLGDAPSLQGGMLLATGLRGGDGAICGFAQGSVSVGGFGAGGKGGGEMKNHLAVGRVPQGGWLTQALPMSAAQQAGLCLSLHQPDFTTATRIAARINEALGSSRARALGAESVQIDLQGERPVELMARVEDLEVSAEAPARVVINERTGTVVLGAEVRILPVAIAHGGLTVRVRRSLQVSQPPPLSGGSTVVVPQERTQAQEEDGALMALDAQATLQDLIRALNALEVKPRDLIAIIQALKQAGALQAELVVM